MKVIQAPISEQLDSQIESLLKNGWFDSREKLVQEAIRRFVDSHQPELMEHFVRDDVEWGLRGRN
jgi:Arc/MetJ-type ribon-helix-helix transcriptional regulator